MKLLPRSSRKHMGGIIGDGKLIDASAGVGRKRAILLLVVLSVMFATFGVWWRAGLGQDEAPPATVCGFLSVKQMEGVTGRKVERAYNTRLNSEIGGIDYSCTLTFDEYADVKINYTDDSLFDGMTESEFRQHFYGSGDWVVERLEAASDREMYLVFSLRGDSAIAYLVWYSGSGRTLSLSIIHPERESISREEIKEVAVQLMEYLVPTVERQYPLPSNA